MPTRYYTYNVFLNPTDYKKFQGIKAMLADGLIINPFVEKAENAYSKYNEKHVESDYESKEWKAYDRLTERVTKYNDWLGGMLDTGLIRQQPHWDDQTTDYYLTAMGRGMLSHIK